MNRKELLGKIGVCLARFTAEVKQFNTASQYDINIHAENVLIPLLQEVFDFRGLANANVLTKNAPAVDLIDHDNRVSVQVTATADADKITHTLTKFTENELYKPFDRLLIYIITERQQTYRKDFKPLLPEGYDFDPSRDIIDNDSLYKYISEQVPSVQKLQRICRILSDEFTDIKIEERQLTTEYSGRTEAKSDRIFPNLLLVSVPRYLYLADLRFDAESYRKELQADLKKRQKIHKLRHLTEKDDLRYYFQLLNVAYSDDYVLYEKKVLTFRNLHDSTERLRNVIDLGTITRITPDEFINENVDREKVFKWLMTVTLTEDLKRRGIEWVHRERLFRFRMTAKPPRPLKVQGKGKVGKSVIVGVKSAGNETVDIDEDGTERVRKGKHFVCFRHAAFATTFNNFGGKWYMTVQPNWSFTSPKNGWKPSPFADKYATGLKLIEKNAAVLDSFQFLATYLINASQGDMMTPGFTLQLSTFPKYFETQPAIPDDVWAQSEPKNKEDKNQLNIEYIE